MTTTQFKSIEQENLYNLLVGTENSIAVAAELLHLFTNDEVHEVLNKIKINLPYDSTIYGGWYVLNWRKNLILCLHGDIVTSKNLKRIIDGHNSI